MRLGIFGGSFDPVHYGHLLLAECCRETLSLDEVWLVPAAVPPHKQSCEL
ncbi:adenylyltransferase/cytidyltransferase family protein, partial [Actinomadura bangladeshensis]|nr:adenylyltransferase/cytidyltransferase family protein [Actinomadura bangladeshensis]